MLIIKIEVEKLCIPNSFLWYDLFMLKSRKILIELGAILVTLINKGRTTARDEILIAAKNITQEREEKTFHLSEVLQYMKSSGTVYKDSTIRTHVTSKCCSNSPVHHYPAFNDYERVGKGLYRLILE